MTLNPEYSAGNFYLLSFERFLAATDLASIHLEILGPSLGQVLLEDIHTGGQGQRLKLSSGIQSDLEFDWTGHINFDVVGVFEGILHG